MIENIQNPLIFGIFTMFVGIIAFVINLKLRNEELEKNELCKISILSFMMGVMNSILFIVLTNNPPSVKIPEQQFMTGTPAF